MALFAILTSFALGGHAISCTFAGETPAEPVLAVTMEPVPSLKDRPGLYRVILSLGDGSVRGNAQPIASQESDAVMIRAKNGASSYYTIGLRRDGMAAMHVSEGDARVTLTGRCQHHEPWVAGWLRGAMEE